MTSSDSGSTNKGFSDTRKQTHLLMMEKKLPMPAAEELST